MILVKDDENSLYKTHIYIYIYIYIYIIIISIVFLLYVAIVENSLSVSQKSHIR